jgi:peptidoglycan/xylan/chitin deacetylase (PgdA/CDA1 family)
MTATPLAPLCFGVCLLAACAPRVTAGPAATSQPCPVAAPSPTAPNAPLRYGPIPVALTIDDLPGTVEPMPGYPKSRVMTELIATLQAHGVTNAVGFVNGVAASDADAQLGLTRWIEAGLAVGNHTFSHRSARELGAVGFLEDVARNQAFLLPLLHGATPQFFRFPYLERGNSPEERIQITQALAQQGYRVANVSIDFADWAFVQAYVRCTARGDEAALRSLSEGYLQNAVAALTWSVEAGQRLFGRTVPQVLLLHALVPTARNLDALMTSYEEQGVRWIALEEALRDEAFAEPPDRDHGDTTNLAEAIRQKQDDLRSAIPRPMALLELACR